MKNKVFELTPQWARGPLLGMHSMLHARKKYGAVFHAELEAARRRACLSAGDLQQAQKDLLGVFLKRVAYANDFYRSMMCRVGIELEEIGRDPVSSLLQLEIMEKDYLKSNIADVQSGGISTFAVTSTGGTTGSPMRIPYDAEGYQKGFAYWRRFYDVMGLGSSFRNARFSANIVVGRGRTKKPFWVTDWSERRTFFSRYHMAERNLPAYVDQLNDYRPHLIDGFPSALSELARYILSTGRPLTFIPSAIAVTAETLLDSDREAIEQAFRSKVFNQYASSEGSPFIAECGRGRLHMHTDTGYFEFLDVFGQSDVKQLVVTSFRNLKLPLIRYRIGDMVRLDPEENAVCECGSFFPTVLAIEGRLDDLLYTTERGSIGNLSPIFKGFSVARSQIVQTDLDDFSIFVVPGHEYTSEMIAVIEARFRERAGSSVKVNVKVVEDIAPAPNGKVRLAVNLWRPREGLVS